MPRCPGERYFRHRIAAVICIRHIALQQAVCMRKFALTYCGSGIERYALEPCCIALKKARDPPPCETPSSNTQLMSVLAQSWS